MKHWLSKLYRTLQMCGLLLMARMFGKYEYSGWNGEFEYARYRWGGMSVFIPTKFEKSERGEA